MEKALSQLSSLLIAADEDRFESLFEQVMNADPDMLEEPQEDKIYRCLLIRYRSDEKFH